MSSGRDDPSSSDSDLQYLEHIDPSLACFVLLAKFLGVPAEPSQIVHDRGRGLDPFTLEDLARVAKKLKLIARLKNTSIA